MLVSDYEAIDSYSIVDFKATGSCSARDFEIKYSSEAADLCSAIDFETTYSCW
jgi:hypothetical protein